MIELILCLSQLPGIGNGSIRKIMEHNKLDNYSISEIENLMIEMSKKISRIRIPHLNEIESAKNRAEKIIKDCYERNIEIISYYDNKYPNRFKNIKDYPILIYTKGNSECLNREKNIAIIGTREPSEIGLKTAYKLGEWFAKNGYVITSGLAIGCDTAAHTGCVNAGGQTVAIVANGLDTIYPKINKSLVDRIIDANGCILSEYPPFHKTQKGNFVERDRLQSALAQGVVVVETKLNGGSMHAVKFGLDQGRKIACVVNQTISNTQQEGNLSLVADGKAVILSNTNELIEYEKDLGADLKKQAPNSVIIQLKNTTRMQLSLFDEEFKL